ncbi:MAG TPA: hypothetical protein VGD71_24400 [Kribbella sp.]|jgi:hypothetical protein
MRRRDEVDFTSSITGWKVAVNQAKGSWLRRRTSRCGPTVIARKDKEREIARFDSNPNNPDATQTQWSHVLAQTAEQDPIFPK